MSEPLKQYIWEAVPGATSPETASALIIWHVRPVTGKDVADILRSLGVAFAGTLDALAGLITGMADTLREAFDGLITGMADTLREAFDGAKTTTQKDFALA